ncbi:hypothetical protein [Methylocapsa sp. S129]|uniref:hypothetical protein n=1 Tax=Methylocapsa sp. S129 TaxID=1641869 RepID=UPI001FEE210B|nr:hypothetical protein [Methylocapsa sp. S129]
MSLRSLASRSVAALTGAAMLALSLNPAAAFTLSGPSLGQSVASAQIDKVWWRHSWGWGWGPAAVFGGLAGGALVGSALAGPGYYGYGPGYYGPGYYGPGPYYGGCWRRVADYYGRPFWTRVC